MGYKIDNWNKSKIATVTNEQKEGYLFELINFLKTLENNKYAETNCNFKKDNNFSLRELDLPTSYGFQINSNPLNGYPFGFIRKLQEIKGEKYKESLSGNLNYEKENSHSSFEEVFVDDYYLSQLRFNNLLNIEICRDMEQLNNFIEDNVKKFIFDFEIDENNFIVKNIFTGEVNALMLLINKILKKEI